jgi:hypothetical protein
MGVLGCSALGLAAPETSEGIFYIAHDGSISAQLTRWAGTLGINNTAPQVQFNFGLPKTAPARQWQEEKVPLFYTCWEHRGIRYTQTAMISSLKDDDLQAFRGLTTNAVLMVRVAGENTNSEYTEGTAEFAVYIDCKAMELQLMDGLVQIVPQNQGQPGPVLAAIDIPATGIRQTLGAVLTFQGNIPPGEKGAMTIKIPLGNRISEASLLQLRDLDFESELRRVKKAWKSLNPSGTGLKMPLVFN